MTMARYPFELPRVYGALHPSSFPADFHIVCLWSAFGLALSAVMFAAGYGAEIGRALMAIG